jgi:histidinol dehydrogenase
MMKRLNTRDNDFRQLLRTLLEGEVAENRDVLQTVDRIIQRVRDEGDSAVVELTNQLDRLNETDIGALRVTREQIDACRNAVAEETLKALQQAEARVRAYAQRQKMESWQYQEADGTILGQQVTPLDSVGVYVPGGTAAYPSSVIMNVVPAKVAGVERIVMVVPTPDGVINDMVLAAADVAGVDEIYRIGGAQAVAALAYGTETIAPVDKIVGPGNIYVAMAKRQVFGKVGIDMIAGPSEILVLCDGTTDPDWIAMDLFSQAEHDVLAQSILVCPDEGYISRVEQSIDRLLPEMPRRDIIRQSLNDRGAAILARDMDDAIAVANLVAAEHLELSVADPEAILPKIRHAGAIFMGAYSTEVLGDYCAGPNHVLPTSGTARFSSPLGVYDFQKRSSIIHCSADGARQLADIASTLAHGEGLTAHARSAEMRLEN